MTEQPILMIYDLLWIITNNKLLPNFWEQQQNVNSPCYYLNKQKKSGQMTKAEPWCLIFPPNKHN